MIDPAAHGIVPHQPSIIGLQQVGSRPHIVDAGIKSQVGNGLDWKIGGSKLSTEAGTTGVGASSLGGFRCQSGSALNWRKGAGGAVDSHVLQHVRRRLKWRLANLVHADRVLAVFTSHRSVACNILVVVYMS
jgi:hypothetical protein